jgi:hypothetical protein
VRKLNNPSPVTELGWTKLPDGKVVSTVRLGSQDAERLVVWLPGDPGDGAPLIFQTWVFSKRRRKLDCAGYATEPEALAGHDAMVAKWRKAKRKAAKRRGGS